MARTKIAHPLARQGWRLLRNRSEVDRRLVFDALQRRLEVGPTTTKQEQALYALGRWMELNGESKAPSRRQYDQFRDGQVNKQDWPSATLIRNAYGKSWEAATAAAEGRPQPDVPSRRLLARGKRFDPDEVKRALQDWAATVPDDQPLRQADFLAWSRRLMNNPGPGDERAPTSDQTIRITLGGWPEALMAIDALDRHPRPAQGNPPRKKATSTEGVGSTEGTDSTYRESSADRAQARDNRASSADGTQANTGEVDLSSAPASGSGFFSSEQLAAWVAWAARASDRPGDDLTRADYIEFRQRATKTAADKERVLRMPGIFTLESRFGAWAQIRHQAGLSRSRKREPNREPYTREELLEAVREALRSVLSGTARDQASVGGNEAAISDAAAVSDPTPEQQPLCESGYRRWRDRRLGELRRKDPTARLPHVESLKNHLGGPKREWTRVLATATQATDEREGNE
jgi:hypothetical protein